ncbi:MAG: molybdenum cofactor guanylyltransferase [Cyanobacteria bacterium P01_G01_bin.54]
MQIVSLILAGGNSSRMGSDKAQLPWRGQTLLSHVVQVAQGVTEVCHVITPWPERYRSQVAGAVFLLETEPGQGPLVGFAQGLAAIAPTYPQLDWLLLLACDLPYLEVALLQRWGQQLETVDAALLAMVPYHNDRWEPLCAFYRPTIFPALKQAIAQNQRSFQTFLSTLPCQPLTLPPEQHLMLCNCNTPADWQGVHDQH